MRTELPLPLEDALGQEGLGAEEVHPPHRLLRSPHEQQVVHRLERARFVVGIRTVEDTDQPRGESVRPARSARRRYNGASTPHGVPKNGPKLCRWNSATSVSASPGVCVVIDMVTS
ncbi:MAG: hypothetical protein ABIZ05_06990 [Pseudonocardiaceae bacterium]